jgi:type IV pilus assembly protein PilE
MLRSTQRNAGFSLLELMIVVAVIGILAAIALPSYNEYITRSKISEATANLSDIRTKMEAYYMDNRRYSSTAGGGTCGISGGNTPNVTNSKYFTYACASSGANASGDQAYTITATGVSNQGMNGFVLTIDQSNTKVTTGVGAGWTVPSSNCWVQKKNGNC